MAPHGKCCGDANHHHESEELGIQYSLYTKIDKDNVECLNEARDGSGKTVFKSWEDRLNSTDFVESDADEELLFNIPFTGNVKLKGIRIIGEDSETHPAKMRLFKNRPSMTFDDMGVAADQEFELVKDNTGSVEYGTKVVTFNNVHHLTIHFPTNFGGDSTKIYYIGLKGEFSEAHHHGVTICTYEARPMADDHKNPLEDSMNIPPGFEIQDCIKYFEGKSIIMVDKVQVNKEIKELNSVNPKLQEDTITTVFEGLPSYLCKKTTTRV